MNCNTVHVDDKEDLLLKHYGILGMRWGVRRYQNEDGSLTSSGRDRYLFNDGKGFGSAWGSIKKFLWDSSASSSDVSASYRQVQSSGFMDRFINQSLSNLYESSKTDDEDDLGKTRFTKEDAEELGGDMEPFVWRFERCIRESHARRHKTQHRRLACRKRL